MKYLLLSLIIIYGCNTAQKTETENINSNPTSLSQLLNDTFVDKENPILVDSDSLEKAIFKQLHYKNLKSIESYDVEKLTIAYSDLLKHLAKANDSTQSKQNEILFKIFEQLNLQQSKIDESTEMEINAKLKMARLKSEIWPFFKK